MELRQAAKKIRLVALDLDGSCLNSGKIVTERTKAAIRGLIRKGIEVVPATGREFAGLRENVIGVNGIRYVISGNGAVVTDGADGRRLKESLIPYRMAASLADELLIRETFVYLHQKDEESMHRIACRFEKLIEDCQKERDWPDNVPVLKSGLGDFIRKKGHDIVMLGAYFRGFDGFSVFRELLKRSYPEIRGYRVDQSTMEFISPQAGKEKALLYLCHHLQILPNQVCAFGDHENDIEMLRMAGIGIAMGNALQSVKQAADTVTKNNDDEGVAEFCEAYFLREDE